MAEPWRRAVVHLSLCFILGCFIAILLSNYWPVSAVDWRRSFNAAPSSAAKENLRRKLVITVTTTTTTETGDLKNALLRKTAVALSLVPPPLLWLVVEPQPTVNSTAELLRRTTVMYRHLPSDPISSVEDQNNLALSHIAKHRLDGLVLFAPISAVFDLRLFDHIRRTQAMVGAWPTAGIAPDGTTVDVDGPVCRSSRVVDWRSSAVDLAGVSFNSSILWRRNSSDLPQGLVGLVRQAVLEERNSVEPVPSPDCANIMTWHLPSRPIRSRE
ncbi:putative glucuronosyltransferase Os03g0287800 [Wolffia australiana]